ncbi:hypothetical protein IT568_00685 [bacterium]|nr:hypothetical protein [bacterium]
MPIIYDLKTDLRYLQGVTEGVSQGIEQGEFSGKLFGLCQGVKDLLEVKFGFEEAMFLFEQVEQIRSPESLKNLAQKIKTANSTDEVKEFLKQNQQTK